MAETVPGGVYRVGDKWLNAEGKEVSAPKGAGEGDEAENQRMRAPNDDLLIGGEPAGDTSPAGDTQEGDDDALDGVDFASAAARTAAEEAGLTAADFKGERGSGADGFTKPDVMALIEARG